jgi:RNA polymerase sigma-70 factor (ECF subfamily)
MAGPDPLAELLSATARGDRAAFARLYELTSGKLFALALGILRRRDWAEEVLQEAFIRLWRSAHRFDPAKGSAMSWMVTIVRNSALTALERRPREISAEDVGAAAEPADTAPDPLEQAMQSSQARALFECLQHLEEPQRRSIMLAYYEGLTHTELAARLAAPLGTVKSWIRRGLMHLKECLEGGNGQA